MAPPLHVTLLVPCVPFVVVPQFPVLATRSGGYVDDEEEGGGRTELPSLLERGRVLRLRAALEDETRRSMTYAEFESLCEDCGMDEADARKVQQHEYYT